jgi:hypothetical protein
MGNEETGALKIKKPSLKREESATFKVNLSEKPQDKVETTEEIKTEEQETVEQSKQENLIKEVVEDTTIDTNLDNHTPEPDYPIGTKHLPENVQKLVDFMNETGGNLEDYVRLNVDYSAVDGKDLLKQYYKTTKPHLNDDDINLIFEDKFEVEEDIDDEREARKKQLAQKEEIEKAKTYFEDVKSKYYEDIKLKSNNVSADYQKAMDFFNRYNTEQETAKRQHDDFLSNTNNYFDDNFEGFDFKVAGKSFKYGVTNPRKVAENQSNINSFVGKFLDEKGSVTDYKGYHKAIYSAQNVDTIAEHFYEQGKADAIKDITAKETNITNNTSSSPTGGGDIFINGFKVKAIDGVDSSKLRIKRKNKT